MDVFIGFRVIITYLSWVLHSKYIWIQSQLRKYVVFDFPCVKNPYMCSDVCNVQITYIYSTSFVWIHQKCNLIININVWDFCILGIKQQVLYFIKGYLHFERLSGENVSPLKVYFTIGKIHFERWLKKPKTIIFGYRSKCILPIVKYTLSGEHSLPLKWSIIIYG